MYLEQPDKDQNELEKKGLSKEVAAIVPRRLLLPTKSFPQRRRNPEMKNA